MIKDVIKVVLKIRVEINKLKENSNFNVTHWLKFTHTHIKTHEPWTQQGEKINLKREHFEYVTVAVIVSACHFTFAGNHVMATTATSTGEKFRRLLGGLPAVLHNKCLMPVLSTKWKLNPITKYPSFKNHTLLVESASPDARWSKVEFVPVDVMMACGGEWKYNSTYSKLVTRGENWASDPSCFTEKKRAFGTQRKGGDWIDTRTCLKVPVKRSTSCFCRSSDRELSLALPIRYIHYKAG